MFDGLSNYINKVVRGKKIRINGKTAQWRKVSELKVGVKIAVTEPARFDTPVEDRTSQVNLGWDEIVSIKKLGQERVYDIEVEGTHNFVGNGIVAHNTYINLDNKGDVKLVDNATGSVYSGNLDSPSSPLFSLITPIGEAITRVAAFSKATIANLRAGTIQAEKIISPIVETEKIVSPIVETTEIKPVDKDIVINLDNGSSMIDNSNPPSSINNHLSSNNKGDLARLIIKGLEGKSAVVIDAAGNASFSGQLIADSIQINNDATVAGTLTAQSSIINHLSSDDASISGKLIAGEIESSTINDIQKLLAEIKDQPLPDTNSYQNLNTDDRSLIIDNSSSSPSSINNHLSSNSLTVTGQSNLYNLSVANSLLVGTTIIDQNSIISLASELRLSALSKINLFDGAVMIAKDGTITTRGELIAERGIRTDEIKPLTDNGQVSINNLAINNLTISNISTNSAIIAAPDNFQKNGLFAPAIETATSSAGIGILPENSSEVVIYNNNIKKDSLIYLTPTNVQTQNFASLQAGSISVEGKPYFKVVTNTPSTLPTKFNWLIIN